MKSKIVKRKKKEVDTIASLKKIILKLKRQLLQSQQENIKANKAARPKNKPFDNCVMKDFPDK